MYLKRFFIFALWLNSTVSKEGPLCGDELFYKALRNLPWVNGSAFDTLWNIMSLASDDHEVVSQDSNYCGANKQYDPQVTHPDFGVARGKTIYSFSGRNFSAFQGIPFAQPITSKIRFSMPNKWSGKWTKDDSVFNATYIRAKCPQISILLGNPAGREDCLQLNIYTPDTEGKYPVMFFIHGGGFISGDATLYIPTKLLDQDVVVVVIQYRLGSLGFLASNQEENPGNMGLMDQIIALQWVQEHISYFGGDPELITIFGQSAGAASASWLQFSPLIVNAVYRRHLEAYNEFSVKRLIPAGGGYLMLWGCFKNPNENPPIHRIILQSGSALETWAHDPDPESSFIIQANQLNCWDDTQNNPVTKALKCMRGKSIEEVVQGYYDVSKNDRFNAGLGFRGNCPVIQKEFLAQNPSLTSMVVISDSAFNLINKKQYLNVPVMAGAVREEGSLVLGLIYTSFLVPHNLYDDYLFLSQGTVPLLTTTFGINDVTGSVAHSLEMSFLQYAEMGNWDSMSGGLVDMTGMQFLKSGAWSLVHYMRMHEDNEPIFFYSFEFESDDSIFDWLFLSHPDIPIPGGVIHTDDLLYLFYLPALMIGDQDQITTVNRMTHLWSNFAKYGDPTPDGEDQDNTWMEDIPRWQPFSLKEEKYMLMKKNFTVEREFTTRWRPNTIMEPPSNLSSETTTKVTTTSEADAEVSTPTTTENGIEVSTVTTNTTDDGMEVSTVTPATTTEETKDSTSFGTLVSADRFGILLVESFLAFIFRIM